MKNETKKVPGTFFLERPSGSERYRFAEKGTRYLFGHDFLRLRSIEPPVAK